MYVIVEIAGQQFKAEKGRKLYVHRLSGEVDSSVSFDKVLLTDNDGQVKVGAPVVEGASVKAKILKHLKDDKVIVFKKRRRKGYRVKNGHRQCLTQILVEDIIA
ncbi:MAG: 50S ribosomal protein L21 [Rikenellaceae bacterium]|jgi:large subunit ribosomal protein L21|nr:50S ribosomal protein L21 [Rikenellaceae bacterium]MBP3612322.1 50S ribosomal protein L21 [Rikenellaceae bacterium]MBP3682559.1 50S ribosomal protein L21 [Rikenellaceae bacterium]MBQ1989712.1 50S ribosomal protein L21 [Rikenellaceae bacterium]MBQ2019966.1 50S ribosomal protein L21 [Rikenellaceae bacterium]